MALSCRSSHSGHGCLSRNCSKIDQSLAASGETSTISARNRPILTKVGPMSIDAGCGLCSCGQRRAGNYPPNCRVWGGILSDDDESLRLAGTGRGRRLQDAAVPAGPSSARLGFSPWEGAPSAPPPVRPGARQGPRSRSGGQPAAASPRFPPARPALRRCCPRQQTTSQ